MATPPPSIDTTVPNRDDIHRLLWRVGLRAGLRKVVRYYYEPGKDGAREKLPLGAVVFDEPEEIEQHPDGARWHRGNLLFYLWAPEKHGGVANRARGNAKLDELKRSICDLISMELPRGRNSSTQFQLIPKRYREFFWLEEGPCGGALEIDYNYLMTPVGPASPEAFNLADL